MQLVQCLNMPTIVFSQRSHLLCSLQLELHLLMVHLLMVHLPMVHLHVLHLLAMHLIGLQLVQCIDTPTVVFRLQLIMHHCKPLGGSKQELEEREQVMRRRTHGGTLAWVISIPSLEQEVGTITTASHGLGHFYHRFPHLGQP